MAAIHFYNSFKIYDLFAQDRVYVFRILPATRSLHSRKGRLAQTVAFWRLRSPEGALLRQGFVEGKLSGSVPFYRPTGVSRQLPQVPSGKRRPQTSKNRVCASKRFMDCCSCHCFVMICGKISAPRAPEVPKMHYLEETFWRQQSFDSPSIRDALANSLTNGRVQFRIQDLDSNS